MARCRIVSLVLWRPPQQNEQLWLLWGRGRGHRAGRRHTRDSCLRYSHPACRPILPPLLRTRLSLWPTPVCPAYATYSVRRFCTRRSLTIARNSPSVQPETPFGAAHNFSVCSPTARPHRVDRARPTGMTAHPAGARAPCLLFGMLRPSNSPRSSRSRNSRRGIGVRWAGRRNAGPHRRLRGR